jgi:hypothetical protein
MGPVTAMESKLDRHGYLGRCTMPSSYDLELLQGPGTKQHYQVWANIRHFVPQTCGFSGFQGRGCWIHSYEGYAPAQCIVTRQGRSGLFSINFRHKGWTSSLNIQATTLHLPRGCWDVQVACRARTLVEVPAQSSTTPRDMSDKRKDDASNSGYADQSDTHCVASHAWIAVLRKDNT